jgi:hypothetical protein
MKINFYNLYHLQNGHIELNDFNVIVGKNNTNKTSLAYATYTMFKSSIVRKNLSRTFMKSEFIDDLFKDLNSSFVEINLSKFLFDNIDQIFKLESFEAYSIMDHAYFQDFKQNNNNPFFNRDFCNNDDEFIELNKEYLDNKNEIDSDYSIEQGIFSFKVVSNDNENYSKSKSRLSLLLSEIYSELPIFSKNMHFFPVGRDVLLQNADLLHNRVENMISQDYINLYKDILDLSIKSDENSIYDEIIESLESSIFKGNLKLIKNGLDQKLVLQEDNCEEYTDLDHFSSSAKSLALFILYLKYMAKESDFLIIDEPELSLHPDGIYHFTKELLKLTHKYNIKVLILTHSDYVINIIKTYLENNQEFIKRASLYTANRVEKEDNGYKKLYDELYTLKNNIVHNKTSLFANDINTKYINIINLIEKIDSIESIEFDNIIKKYLSYNLRLTEPDKYETEMRYIARHYTKVDIENKILKYGREFLSIDHLEDYISQSDIEKLENILDKISSDKPLEHIDIKNSDYFFVKSFEDVLKKIRNEYIEAIEK